MQPRLLLSLLNVFLFVLLISASQPTADAKEQKAVVTQIEINAPPQVVFEALRKMRNASEFQRHLKSFDGKIALIDENMQNVVIYGKVDNLWQETEQPYKRMDYKLVKSNHFKEGSGSWILTPSADGKSTVLEHDSYLDSGLMVPFAGTLTRNESAKTSRVRLEWLKKTAEQMEKDGGIKDSSK